jgi:hypothetical protein
MDENLKSQGKSAVVTGAGSARVGRATAFPGYHRSLPSNKCLAARYDE